MITAPQAKAIRNADSLCFDHHPDGTGAIRAIKRAENSSTGFEQTISIPVTMSRINNYGSDEGPFVCFAMILSVQYNDIARTLTRHIKAGSEIALTWTRDNSSPVTKEAGLFVDYLNVTVQNGKVAGTFRVADFIGHNNSARMTQLAPKEY